MTDKPAESAVERWEDHYAETEVFLNGRGELDPLGAAYVEWSGANRIFNAALTELKDALRSAVGDLIAAEGDEWGGGYPNVSEIEARMKEYLERARPAGRPQWVDIPHGVGDMQGDA